MNFYAYQGAHHELGHEPLGTADKILSFRGEYHTLRGFLRYRVPASWRDSGYRVYTFTNFYNPRTFTLVAHVNGQKA